jgi:hypothetical protein
VTDKQFLVIKRSDNKLLKLSNLIVIDTPKDWYDFHCNDDNNIIRSHYNGLISILTTEKLEPKNLITSNYPREQIKFLFARNKTKLRALAQKYKFQYILYHTKTVKQFIALHFLCVKYEFLFKLKFAHLLKS